jgi:rare lipoprotein A
MIARAMRLLPTAATLALVATPCLSRPLLLSDLPPDVRILPSAEANRPASAGPVQYGTASWYGASHAGRRTSSGERFNPGGLTAAHATLPLGSRVRVVREDTGTSVVVTVNDRIGSHRSVIDLSRGAAEALGMVAMGMAPVRLVALDGDVIVPREMATDVGESPTAQPSAAMLREVMAVQPMHRATVHVGRPVWHVSNTVPAGPIAAHHRPGTSTLAKHAGRPASSAMATGFDHKHMTHHAAEAVTPRNVAAHGPATARKPTSKLPDQRL